jgi:hypothetical protein
MKMRSTKWDPKRRAWLPCLSRKIVALLCLTLTVGLMGAATQIELTTQVKGILPEANGGTHLSTYTLGDLVYASAANTLAKLAGNTTATNKFLCQTGTGSVSAAPGWCALIAADIPNHDASKITTGTLAAARLGSGSGGSTKFLREDSTWQTIGAALTVTSNETPAGTINGSNVTFTTANSCTNLYLFKNGQRMTPGASADYTVSGVTITFTSGGKPLTGDVLLDDCEF